MHLFSLSIIILFYFILLYSNYSLIRWVINDDAVYLCREPVLVSSTREKTGHVTVREQLLQYVVDDRGVMIAVYSSGGQSCVIKIKNVSNHVGEDWHFLLPSEVIASRAILACIENLYSP